MLDKQPAHDIGPEWDDGDHFSAGKVPRPCVVIPQMQIVGLKQRKSATVGPLSLFLKLFQRRAGGSKD